MKKALIMKNVFVNMQTILLYLLLCISSNSNAAIVGVEINTDHLYQIDPSTADLTEIGTVSDAIVASLAWDSTSKILQEYLNHDVVAPLLNGAPNSDGLFNLCDVLVIQRKAFGLIDF